MRYVSHMKNISPDNNNVYIMKHISDINQTYTY